MDTYTDRHTDIQRYTERHGPVNLAGTRQTNKHTDRQTDMYSTGTHRDRQTCGHRQTGRHVKVHRETGRHMETYKHKVKHADLGQHDPVNLASRIRIRDA